MASFVVHLKMSPSEYKALTVMERDAILTTARNRK